MLPGNQPYVTPTQLAQYLPASALSLATSAQQLQACLDATEEADGFLRGRYGDGSTGPFIVTAVGADIVRHTAAIAIYNLMDGPIGWAAQAGSDRNIKLAFVRAVGGPNPDNPAYVEPGFFPRVQRQAIHPDITPNVTMGSNAGPDLPQVSSLPLRGWQTGNRIGGF